MNLFLESPTLLKRLEGRGGELPAGDFPITVKTKGIEKFEILRRKNYFLKSVPFQTAQGGTGNPGESKHCIEKLTKIVEG